MEILLVATVIGGEDDLLGRVLLEVGDVEETDIVVEKLLLALVDLQVLPHHDNAICLLAFAGLVSEFGHMLFQQADYG